MRTRKRCTYEVLIYNYNDDTGFYGYGQTRRQAFNDAMLQADDRWLRAGGDKLATLYALFSRLINEPDYRSAGTAKLVQDGAMVRWKRKENE